MISDVSTRSCPSRRRSIHVIRTDIAVPEQHIRYPPAFVAYLARLLLARDERCAAWWAGAKSAGTETPQELFARFEASVAKTLAERWRGKAGALAAALIKRFGGRFPFDAEQQIRLCFGLLSEDVLRGSFFDQNFSTDRDEVMEVFLAMDRDGNGMLTRDEIQDTFQSIGDGWLSKPEVEQMLKEALANSNGEVDVAGFKAAVAASLTAPRARAAQGLPDAEWWRDPAALLPAPMLTNATSAVLQEAHEKYSQDGGIQAQPLQREKPLNFRIYALFTLAGALACTMTHVALVPLDVVKTLQQTEPSRFSNLGLLAAGHRLVKENGVSGLFLGFWPTMAGYTWYGASVFPGYELFKRKLMEVVGPRKAVSLRVPTILLAGAMATFFACIGVCPAEAIRIRTVAERGFRPEFLSSFHHLFAGFPPLLLRQVFFGMAKFLVFDTVAAMVYRQFPWMANRKRSSSFVSMFSGALAGIISTFVSQPADAILTCLSTTPQLGIAGAAAALWRDGQFGAFYAGFSTRAAWAAAIIGGQFLLYDVAKRIFQVTHGDLSQTADGLSTALRSEKVFQPAAANLAGRDIAVQCGVHSSRHGQDVDDVALACAWGHCDPRFSLLLQTFSPGSVQGYLHLARFLFCRFNWHGSGSKISANGYEQGSAARLQAQLLERKGLRGDLQVDVDERFVAVAPESQLICDILTDKGFRSFLFDRGIHQVRVGELPPLQPGPGPPGNDSISEARSDGSRMKLFGLSCRLAPDPCASWKTVSVELRKTAMASLESQLSLLESLSSTYPFPAEFKLEFDDDQHINVISHLCKSPKGPSTIAFLLPGVHGGVGPCRQPGSNFDSSCLYAMLAERLLDTSDAIDVYRISWQFMRPGLEYALNSICRVLHYALKKARHRGSTSIRVVFVGHSLGAQVAVHAAYVLSRLQADGHAFLGKAGESMSMDVRGLCTLNAPVNNWEVAADVQKALVPLKALLVSGDADEVVKPRSTKKLFKALRCKDKRHLELAGGTHDLFQHKDLLTEEVSQFILDIAEEPA
ncbi:mcfN [Symbiodinium natans]|uniref:McfN protein n=1 Tax=Symbiodinium natans TaxID=878477 RepID=A0A812KFF6_9DINO|nr:mcfN [Symbiodinium natans]